jgi:DNA polymerase-3 subunit epsilon
MRFLNAELEWAGLRRSPTIRRSTRWKSRAAGFPGSPASLDALCRRFGIDNSMREKHGALLDSEILADVYLELIGGKQPDFVLEQGKRTSRRGSDLAPRAAAPTAPASRTKNESRPCVAFVEELGPDAVWTRFRPRLN